ncbi:hypothetical protein MMB75_07230 [Paenibacillus sp. P2(2022)]|uniref:hypothetical protein n=1 Tax=Paenibacillus TaxID=44249 RepID=UPI001C9DB798|nr:MULTISPECIES: hypothetical protein [Paenibacillus]MBY7736716.1 hypothetical protein [Paenibacillus polymyxa]MDG0053461.1 hypothetical protein [Paenibacillus sp. P2(2022)]
MKKKLLIGLLTVAACFSLGSTSFASPAAAAAPDSQAAITQGVTKNAVISRLTLKVGESRYLTGSSFWISGDQGDNNPIYLNVDGLVVGLKPGVALVVADLPDGSGQIEYYITVR